jgi:CRISPR-associated protein Csx10
MHRLKFSIKTLSPIVLTSTSNSTVMTETHSVFGGSIIRGVLASRFVEVQKLGNAAHEDKDFREIFFGSLKFLPATPEILNRRSFVLPMSLQKGKAGTPNGDKVQDLFKSEKSLRGYKTFHGLGVLVDEKFYTAQVKTNIFMHMSRSGDKERLAGRSIDGNVYNYESIDAEQNFQGEILGDEKILRKMIDGLNLDGDKMFAYVGRSRFTQYGKCLVTFDGTEPVKEDLHGEIYLRLETPLIPADDNFLGTKKILETEVVSKLGGKFSLGKVFASGVEIENFVVPWGMKRPRVQALAAGSVFELKIADALTDDDKKSLTEKLFEGFGTRTEEGFGQLRVWTPSENFTVDKLEDEKISKPERFSEETIKLAKKILTAHLSEQIRIYAHEDAEDLRGQLKRRGNMTHFFSRLDGLLSSVDKKNLRENFKARLESEIRGGSPFEEHLKNLYMANGQKFFDVFMGLAPLPHEVHDLLEDSTSDEVRAEIYFNEEDFADDEFFSEYLTNYFRFARKIAADSKGGEARE